MYYSYFMLENIWHHHFTWSGPNSQEIVNFVPIVGPQGPKVNWNQFTISCEFDPLQVKWYHIFPSIKMEEYMEPELSSIFWLKMVAKNTVLGSPGIYFMHVRVNLLPSKENPTNMSYCEFWQELKNTFFIQHFRETASVHYPKTSQELNRIALYSIHLSLW